ncbi:DNA polymerase IV [Anaeromyxobacter diazotrophicus]|uniref:DNA polymerase IV n=1 Tax=Anaeromyxobacter diazotrophicus TaxID=2590199 RepID=A0A7I9VQD4_9BACT|nr:DNA polymerase IV [Anaeromyxobacter diazotrophicus]GEJ58632.1 DNA polymerase IV [Anaeromyxobacter diazotrophicus]
MAGRRAILHLDLDAFYASVEQLDDPSLRGRPVVVAGPSARGVVCAASYEARRFGVRSAMPTPRARRLCPEGVFVPPRFPRYEELSGRVFAIYREYTPLVEPLSLDEAFLDVTASAALHGGGRAIAETLRRRVRAEVGLTVSAGVAEVKLAAKIASDLGKPDGLVEVPAGGTRAFLAPLPVSRLWGVGQVTGEALAKLGLHHVGQLAAAPEALVAGALGSGPARHLLALARGDDPREVVPDEPSRSVGSEETFEQDLAGRAALLPRLLAQAERTARRLREAGLRGRTVTLKVKYADFTLVTRRCTLAASTDDGAAVFAAAREQLERVELDRPVRLVGVSVSGFEERAEQLGLFEPRPAADAARRAAVNAAVDAVNRRFGPHAVRPATLADDDD